MQQLERHEHLIVFANPQASGADKREERIAQLQEVLGLDAKVIEDPPTPSHLAHVEPHTYVASDGGDGTVRSTLAAILGTTPNKEPYPDRSRWNRDVTQKITFFAMAGGNSNNWALSAHGEAATQPELLPELVRGNSVRDGRHRPMVYSVNDAEGAILHSDIATSCFGLGSAADIMEQLEAAKPKFKRLHALARLAGEAALSAKASYLTSAFDVDLIYSGPQQHREIEFVRHAIGLEFIKSLVYAKQGRTAVNVGDDRWQPVVVQAGENNVSRIYNIGSTMSRLKRAKYELLPKDFTSRTLAITNYGKEPIPFHADGEIKDRENEAVNLLRPSATLTARLTDFSVRTLIVTPPSTS